MGCTKCNELKTSICDQTPCIEPQKCDCPVLNLQTKCIIFEGDDLPITGIKKNTIETSMWQQMDAYLGKLKTDLINAFQMVNIGSGAKVFKGIDIFGKKELRTLKTEDTLVIVTENTNDIGVKINSTTLTSFVNNLIPPTQILPNITANNIGTGLGLVFKDNTANVLNFRKLKTTNTGVGASVLNVEVTNENDVLISAKKIKKTNLGTGVDTIESITSVIDEVEIKNRTITSTTGNIIVNLLPDGSIDLNTPTDSNIKSFYINANFIGSSNGTMGKPYKKITEALLAVIGTGTPFVPEFLNTKIILQSNVVVTQADLSLLPVLQNKLSVNTTEILSDFGQKIITFEGTTNYPFDTEFLINGVGFDGNLKLKTTVSLKIINVKVFVDNVFGMIKHKGYFNGVLYEGQNYSEFVTINSVFACRYLPTAFYFNLKDSANNNIIHFGDIVKGQSTIANITPHVYIFNRNGNNDSLFNGDDILIQGTSQTVLKIENVRHQFTVGKIQVTRDSGIINVQANVTNGNYLPKEDVNLIEIVNSDFTRILNLYEQNQYPFNALDNKQVGGDNAYIKLVNSNLILEDYYNYGSHNCNYFAEMDETSNFSNTTATIQNVPIQISHLKNIGVFTSVKDVNFEASNGLKFNNSNFKLVATDAKVNGFNYSSVQGFTNDAQAVSNGLIIGNIYYNTTINALKKII